MTDRMKAVATAASILAMIAGAASADLAAGAAAPAFSLPGVDGKDHALDEYKDAKAVVVIFTCNHCPVAKAYQDRIIALQRDYAGKGVQVVAINSNDAEQFPDDSFENMQKRAEEKGYNFPYLFDESQEIARAYGAKATPHVFVLGADRTLAYSGRIDDATWQDMQKAEKQYLRQALDALLAGEKIEEPATLAFGCSIKWKKP